MCPAGAPPVGALLSLQWCCVSDVDLTPSLVLLLHQIEEAYAQSLQRAINKLQHRPFTSSSALSKASARALERATTIESAEIVRMHESFARRCRNDLEVPLRNRSGKEDWQRVVRLEKGNEDVLRDMEDAEKQVHKVGGVRVVARLVLATPLPSIRMLLQGGPPLLALLTTTSSVLESPTSLFVHRRYRTRGLSPATRERSCARRFTTSPIHNIQKDRHSHLHTQHRPLQTYCDLER